MILLFIILICVGIAIPPVGFALLLLLGALALFRLVTWPLRAFFTPVEPRWTSDGRLVLPDQETRVSKL